MQALKNQSFTRRQYDGCKTNDDLRVTTGPGRYQIDTPPQYCNASFAPEPTIRQQRWGASLNGSFAKTDVESDLLNINRPTTKTICSQYDPTTDEVNQGGANGYEGAVVSPDLFPARGPSLDGPGRGLESVGMAVREPAGIDYDAVRLEHHDASVGQGLVSPVHPDADGAGGPPPRPHGL